MNTLPTAHTDGEQVILDLREYFKKMRKAKKSMSQAEKDAFILQVCEIQKFVTELTMLAYD